jgi:Tol biopolymer transport system component
MPLAPKTRLGPYEILALLGSGGMGEVYRALDTRMDRTVAIKICTGRFTDRFEREVRAISSLNHPHICALYDIGREGRAEFLVMEYLEGESLEQRLRLGPLSIADALRCAVQVASALDAAHRKGIIHRDLKPGNVVLTGSGAKLLDFGLAKMAEPVGELPASKTSLPTVAQSLTAEGSILGTFQYMAPEQLEGKEADARSDIFAFGATLYEMITGRKAFESASQASLIAALMSADPPPVSSLQPMASPALDRLIRKCLAKAPSDRWQTARDLQSELEWIGEPGSQAGVPAPMAAERVRRGRVPWIVAGAAVVLFAASLYFTIAHLREKPSLPAQVSFQIPAPTGLMFHWFDMPAISPDGGTIAFTASTDSIASIKLFVRSLSAAEPSAIAVPGPMYMPFWSPDGRQIAYLGGAGVLQKVSVSGGPPVTLCEGVTIPAGGAWSREGVILVQVKGLLHQLPQGGGQPKPVGSLANGELGQRLPRFLPDGNHFLYISESYQTDRQGIYVGSLAGDTPKFLVPGAAGAEYLDSGYLLFVRGNTLFAQPFNPRSLTLQGEPRAVTDRVSTFSGGPPTAILAASPAGVLVWREGRSTAELRLQWFDRSGKKLETVGDVADYSNPALSPDGKKLAIGIRDPQTTMRDIWILDLVRGARTRLTVDPADDTNPVWSPDGTRIAFTSLRKGERDIYVMPADGTGQAELLFESKDGQKNAEDWSPDSKYLIYNHAPGSLRHLYLLPLARDQKPTPFLKSALRTLNSQFSPNGRWVSYTSSESGRNEVYVQGLDPDTLQPRGKWPISTAGGDDARWRPDGKEMFYYSGRSIMSVDVTTTGASFSARIPHALFDVSVPNGGRNHFVVSRDGKRFLVVTLLDEDQNVPLKVLVNWR